MKIIVTAAPLIGHLNPVLGIARLLHAAGHEVVGYAPSVFRRQIEMSGLGFHPFPPDADVDLADMDRLFPERRTLTPGFAARKVAWERLFVGRMEAEYAGLAELLKVFPADLIIAESMTFATLPLLARQRPHRPAIVHLGATFLQLGRPDHAPIFSGLRPATSDEERADYARSFAEAKAAWFDPIDAMINDVLLRHGCPRLPLPFYDAMILLPDAFLQAGVPELEFGRGPLPPSIRFIGANPPAPGTLPLPTWAKDLDDGRRIVLVTQGTVANADLGQLIAPTLAALADEPDVIVVATTGGRPVEALGTLPRNARVAPYLPYDWLMPKLSLLVTNGGYGTVTHALSMGVPIVQAGMTEDKREVAARIDWTGAGVAIGSNAPTAEMVREAARRVLSTPAYASNAAQLADAFGLHDPQYVVPAVIDALVPGGGTIANARFAMAR
ncbi:UDP:flavonoid glycosyltransferase YjiC (YdhE family) [Sphingomonas zeicaulis]|uniref:glycosyltransferase n=1 Tax=Sphingomonas zeicaulis TaxID=1632740 RepID=UPI003D19923D